jgi:hypothetical protein
MNTIKLTSVNREREVILNWDNVDYAKNTANNFGEEYTEVYFGRNEVGVKESLEEIETLLAKMAENRPF